MSGEALGLHNELNLEPYWMPFTSNRAFKKDPRLFVSARGMYYTTADGRQVMDGMSGLWCCNAGHCHPKLVQAVQAQVTELDYAPAFQMGHPRIFENPLAGFENPLAGFENPFAGFENPFAGFDNPLVADEGSWAIADCDGDGLDDIACDRSKWIAWIHSQQNEQNGSFAFPPPIGSSRPRRGIALWNAVRSLG